jgi:hypothetical protein
MKGRDARMRNPLQGGDVATLEPGGELLQTETASGRGFARGRFPAKASDDTLGGARANPVDQLRHPERCRHRPSRRAGDQELLADIHAIPDTRPA